MLRIFKSKKTIVWVGAWMHRGRLGRWKFENITFLEAIERAKVLFRIQMLQIHLQMAPKMEQLLEKCEPFDPLQIKNSLGETVEFYASNKYLYACTKRAVAHVPK